MVADNKIDADIVTILIANYQDINKARIKAQKKARTRYNDFAKLLVWGSGFKECSQQK